MKSLLLYCSFVAISLFALTSSGHAATFTVTKTADTNDGVCDADCSLREAIAAANAAATDDMIVFDNGVFGTPQTIVLALGQLTVADSTVLTLVGPGEALLSVSGNEQFRVLGIEPGAHFNASGLTITRGRTSGFAEGAGLRNQLGTVVLTNVTFIGNSSDSKAGAIFVMNRSLTLNSCTFLNNSARTGGGAISSNTSTEERPSVVIHNSLFEANTAPEGVGGAIGDPYELDVFGSRFKNNSARSGGAVAGGNHTDTVFEGNTAAQYGGAVAGAGNLTNVEFLGNTAGLRGGAITVGHATISDSRFLNNRSNEDGGAVYSTRSRFSIQSSIFVNNSAARNGGAIFADNSFTTAEILSSTLLNNTSGKDGGAVFNSGGQLDVTASLISGNSATSNAGEGGGAFYNEIATINLINSTVSGNTSSKQGGGVFNRGTVSLVNSTVASNQAVTGGGGIFNFDFRTVTARSTLFADNSSVDPAHAQDFRGTLSSQGFNLLETTTGTTITGVVTGNILNQDPQLVALNDNGGPTSTYGLQPTSPAIDAGDPNNFPITDQRGVLRAQDGDYNGSQLPDIGAYERQLSFLTVNKTSDTNDGTCDSDCSLREALATAVASAAPDKAVIFDSAIFAIGSQIVLGGGELIASSGTGTLVVHGPGRDLLNINANNASRVLYVPQNSIVMLTDLTMSGGNGIGADAANWGGGILSRRAVLSLRRTVVSGNAVDAISGNGGGLYNYRGVLRLADSEIANNAALDGGGIYNTSFGGIVELRNTDLKANSAGALGGGVRNWGTLKVSGGVFRQNTADVGGGIYTQELAEIQDARFELNSAGSGGAIFNNAFANTLNVARSMFLRNTATSEGGAIISLGVALVESTSILDNAAGARGGGISNSGGNLSIVASTISGNRSGVSGGGINNGGTLTITNTTISLNRVEGQSGESRGGGIFHSAPANEALTIHSSTVFRNVSSLGGGITNNSGSIAIRNSIIAKNRTTSSAPDVSGNLTTLGYNLISDTSGGIISGNGSNDITGVDPLLDPLLRNNGGATMTHKPRFASPAIDKGSSTLVSDQRGSFRPVDFASVSNAPGGDGSDIGSFERYPTDRDPLLTQFDFDGDGKADVGVYRPVGGEWWLLNSESGNLNYSYTQFGLPTDILTPADFTGDGITDISVFRPEDGVWYVKRSEVDSYFGFQFGGPGDIPAPADYDGDGKADAAVFRPSEGLFFIFQSSDLQVRVEQFGTNGDQPVAGDFDGDGKADIALWRETTGEWFVLKSSGGFAAVQFGLPGDKAIPADFTGDGITDIAVWRPSETVWYIVRSENGTYYGFPFGLPTDQPIPADYDGDGQADPAVYRPSEGGWYLMQTTAGLHFVGWGTGADRPVPGAFVR